MGRFSSKNRFSNVGSNKILSKEDIIKSLKSDSDFIAKTKGKDGKTIKGSPGQSIRGESGKSITIEETIKTLLANEEFLRKSKGETGETPELVPSLDGVGIKDITFDVTEEEDTFTIILDDGRTFQSPNIRGERGQTLTSGRGQRGLTGAGVPSGGTTGQVIVKSSSTNYDTEWKSTGAVTLITGNYTVLITDDRVEATITSEATITLPDPTTAANHQFRFINHYSSTANMVFSRTIDGVSSPYIAPGESIVIYNNSTEYMIG